jgi:putative nucleotidyltransferase with HDIG domain
LEIDEVARIIDRDQAFAAELLQMANSPLFGLQFTIRSIRHAIVVLGLERTKELAVQVAMQIFLKDALVRHPALRRCWLHSVACAELSKTMAISYARVGVESAYTAGLLHDIGRIALLNVHREDYISLLGSAYQSANEIRSLESQRFGWDHCQVGHGLCNIWKFPEEIGEVALRHHEPVSQQGNNLLNIVRISCHMADSLGFAAVRDGGSLRYDETVSMLPPHLRQRFQYSSEQLRQMVTDRVF